MYRDSKTARARDGKYCAVPGGPPGLFPTPLPGQSTGGVRRVTQTTSIAVPLAATIRSFSDSESIQDENRKLKFGDFVQL